MSTETVAAAAETVAEKQSAAQSIIEREQQYLVQNYGRYPLVLRRGKGSYVYDFEGKRYLDLITGIGVNALGHAHPRILKVLREQAGLMLHCSNLYYHEYQGLLAERISKVSGLPRSFFCNSGTEAVECALKMTRAHGKRTSPEKYEVFALENSFHGRTLGALSLTGQAKYRDDFEPLPPGAKFVKVNDAAGLEAAVTHRTAGVILEVIQGEGGIYPISQELARAARQACDRHDALLIFDEIQCGVGRPGRYFAYQGFEPAIMPDIMVAAKPVALGIPLGVVSANEKAASAIGKGMHGSTFGGGPLACRVALEFIDILEELLPTIRLRSELFRTRLNELAQRYEYIKEVRVFGLMIGVELHMPGKQLVLDMIERGLLMNCTHDVVLRMLPPYTISEPEVDRAISLLDRALKQGLKYWREHQKSATNAVQAHSLH
jgi:predicted acetylornithine/succinylornithine family transaminase